VGDVQAVHGHRAGQRLHRQRRPSLKGETQSPFFIRKKFYCFNSPVSPSRK
jgi:hypothetical protein